jgi:DNA-binding GntR family transcriptional regulator
MNQQLDPEAPEPLWQQLADVLRDQVKRGEIKSRQRLPSQADIVETYGVSRGTATRALRVLAGEGVVRFTPGKGYFAR